MDESRDPESPEAQYTRAPTLEDLQALCRDLNEEGARYAILGGMAVNYYGLVRGTHESTRVLPLSPIHALIEGGRPPRRPPGGASDQAGAASATRKPTTHRTRMRVRLIPCPPFRAALAGGSSG